MRDYDRRIPRAFTVGGIPHRCQRVGVEWALGQAEALGGPVSLYVPAQRSLRDVRAEHRAVDALIARASNADILREVATRVLAGRVIQGMKTAPLADDVLDHWRSRAEGCSPDPD